MQRKRPFYVLNSMFFNEVWWNWASSGFTVLTTTTTTQPRCITLSDTWSCTFTNATTVQTFYVCLMFRAHWAFRKHLWVFNPGFHKCSLCFTSVCVSSLSMSFFREDKLCPFFFLKKVHAKQMDLVNVLVWCHKVQWHLTDASPRLVTSHQTGAGSSQCSRFAPNSSFSPLKRQDGLTRHSF